MERHTNNK